MLMKGVGNDSWSVIDCIYKVCAERERKVIDIEHAFKSWNKERKKKRERREGTKEKKRRMERMHEIKQEKR